MKTDFKQYTIQELVGAWRSGSLVVNPEYQRGASWSMAQMQGLIDSVFRRYPIPPFFLHEVQSRGLGGNVSTKFEIVDGQQRIRALAEFLDGNFALLDSTDKRLRLPNSLRKSPAPWGKRRFSDLDDKLKAEFQEKKLDGFVLTQVTEPDEVRDLFIRLQSGTALTRQQVRDAWPGAVGPFIEKLAGKLKRTPDEELFQQVDRRGSRGDDERDPFDTDRQFCAQLFCLFLARENDPRAQQSIGAGDLDALYHQHTDFDKDGLAAKRFKAVLRRTGEVFENATNKSEGAKHRTKQKFKKLDVIAVFMLIQDLSRNPNFRLGIAFDSKLADYVLTDKRQNVVGKSTSGKQIAAYYESWRTGIVDQLGIHLDQKRFFDSTEKEMIYANARGVCQICEEHVDEADAEYDHFPTAHAMGGLTVVENGRLVHATCHPRGRPRLTVEDESE